MALNQGKYKPSICSIDELDDANLKNDDLQKQQIEGSETAPLTTNPQKVNIDSMKKGSGPAMPSAKDIEKQAKARNSAGSADEPLQGQASGFSVNGLRGRLSFDALMSLSRKRRILYISTACLCAVLLVIIILMIAFWPEVPFYLRAELCLDKECVEAGQQILLWANSTEHRCHNTYEWACGKFTQEYEDNNYYVIKRGEWNFKTYNEYQELNQLNHFIAKLPATGSSDSIESMITSLYASCHEIDTLDKNQSGMLVKQAINAVDGWLALRRQHWDHKKALVHLQTLYGIFPYYKVSVENRYNQGHEYIITLDEGEIGLPDKYFYNIDQDDEIIRAYKLLLRDFAINLGVVSREAELFADDVFHYEKRIVNHISSTKLSSERRLNEIKTLAEVKTLAPSLPILESVQSLFPHTKINDDTEVLVRDVEVLQELSTVVSTSDKKPINNFIIWSLARHLLPHLSKEYRNLIENFDHAVYGRTASYPRWLVCTKIVREWLPFAVDALQQQESHQKTKQSSFRNDRGKTSDSLSKSQANDAVLQLMYHTLKNQLQTSVDQASWIDVDVKRFIKDKLTQMRLQIGIPKEVLDNGTYVHDYYDKLLLHSMYFVEHLESIWSFRRARMEEKLKPSAIEDTIISEMYARNGRLPIAYSNRLNMLIISRGLTISQYYDSRYPVPVNFARIGADILEILIESLSTFVEQFKAEHSSHMSFDLAKVDVQCLLSSFESTPDDVRELSEDALESFHITLSSAKITAKALTTFIESIDGGRAIAGASMDDRVSYETLGLMRRLRVPGLRSFNDNELFTLAYMQKHCSTPIADKDYARIKPHVEQQLAERYLFDATWKHIQYLTRSLSCPVPNDYCPNIL